jgi:glycosyltransferase involved in cell wall biosynthesis
MDKEENNLPPLSIIVPCLNEEHYIGTLLRCLSRQTFHNFEVIVVDGNSEDDTCGVIERTVASLPTLKGKVRCIKARERGVSNQRNFGVENALHERLLFLDADVQIPDSFLKAGLEDIEKDNLDVATTLFEPISERVDDKFFYYLGNIYIQLKQFIQPVAMGFCIFSTKKVHAMLGGFNREIMPGEDFDYVKRAAKLDIAFRVLTRERIYTSVRRLKKEGRLVYYYKAVLPELLGLVVEPKVAAQAVEYKMGNFDEVAK